MTLQEYARFESVNLFGREINKGTEIFPGNALINTLVSFRKGSRESPCLFWIPLEFKAKYRTIFFFNIIYFLLLFGAPEILYGRRFAIIKLFFAFTNQKIFP